jgi:predicted nucleic acid-binding protein
MKLKAQDHLIKELEEKVERITFQKKLNLNVPEDGGETMNNVSSSSSVTTSTTNTKLTFRDQISVD